MKKIVPRKPPSKAAKKRVATKRAVKAPAVPLVGKRLWLPSVESRSAVARALAIGVKAMGSKGALAEFLGVYNPNLSRALIECRQFEVGKRKTVTWPLQHVLKLAQISGVRPADLAPGFFEPQWKATRFRPGNVVHTK